MEKTKRILIMLGLSVALQSFGQNEKQADTLINMKAAIITSSRIQQYTQGNKIQTIDSLAIKNNATNTLSEIISTQTSVQINSYGAGALSNPSIRGTGSAHTAILWNGFNLQDVLNGSIDFSQIPGFFLDDVKLQFGGCSALYGSGALGGAISFNNSSIFDKGVSASFLTSYGSFENHFEGASCVISGKEINTSIRAFNHSIKNNFDFVNNYMEGSPRQKLLNAETKQLGALIDNSILLAKNQKLSFHLWFQNNDHNIPSLMNDTAKSQQNEKNQFVRRTIDWSRIGKKSEFFVRAGYFNNYKYYVDPTYNIRTDYRSVSSVYEFENNYKFNKNFKMNSGLNYTHERGESPNLDNTHVRDRYTVFSSLKYSLLDKKINAIVSLREEMINEKYSPLTYSFGMDAEVLNGFNIKGNINKSYRIPSFNDLYWNDMVWNMFGNPDLKSEEGFNEELGLNYNTKVKLISCEVGVTAFNSNVTNWILWQPVNNFSMWTPMNVDTVWSRGLEFNAGVTYRTDDMILKISGMYTIMKATNESKAADSTLKHKQLIYVPEQKLVANLLIGYKGFSLNYSESYVDDRFTTADNTDKVKAYSTGDLVFSKELNYKNYNLTLDFHINNLWNETYEVMQFYPNPQRNYQVGLRINFNKAKD